MGGRAGFTRRANGPEGRPACPDGDRRDTREQQNIAQGPLTEPDRFDTLRKHYPVPPLAP